MNLPTHPNESFRKRNPHLYPDSYESKVAKFGKGYVDEFCGPKPPPKRIRQSIKPLMNKLEQEWFGHLQVFFPSLTFWPQTVKFKLGNGIWYKPDVVCLDFENSIRCWEVKGPHAFRGGFENLKVAAHKYPEMKWVLVWKQDGKWQEQMVLP